MRKFAISLLTVVSLASPALAQAITMETFLGRTIDEVKSSLVGLGYEVRKVETEDGRIEVYFVGNGKMGEVYVSAETGKPTRIEMK